MLNRFVLSVMLVLGLTACQQGNGWNEVLMGITGNSSQTTSSGLQSIVNGYVKAQGHVLVGEQYMIRALGLKTEEAKMVLEAEALTGTPTKSDIDQSKSVVESASLVLSEGMKMHAGQMSESSKKEFRAGAVFLAKGLQGYLLMSSDIKNYRPSISDVNRGITSAFTIFPSLPDSISSLTSTLQATIQFMKDNDMPPLEQNVTAGLPGF